MTYHATTSEPFFASRIQYAYQNHGELHLQGDIIHQTVTAVLLQYLTFSIITDELTEAFADAHILSMHCTSDSLSMIKMVFPTCRKC